MNPIPHSRYPGARPFEDTPEDQRLFFGRDTDIDTLFHRICTNRLLVLFGKSGLGKSSLLQAGLFPKLRSKTMLPIPVRLNLPISNPRKLVENAIEDAITKNRNIEFTPGNGQTLWEFFKTAMFWQEDLALTPVLVFDQFEEIFTLQKDEARRAFASELGNLANGTPPTRVRDQLADGTIKLSDIPPNVKIILSLREDYLGSLQELSRFVLGIFDCRVRLDPMNRESAEDAIIKPAILDDPSFVFISRPFTYQRDALDLILNYLEGKSGDIEPFQLQQICAHCERVSTTKKNNNAPCLTPADTGGKEEFDDIIKTFYDQAIGSLPRSKRRKARLLCDTGLLSKSGNRQTLTVEQIDKEYGLDQTILTVLENTHLLRKEPRLGNIFYELSHDTLTRAILNSRPFRLSKGLIAAISLLGIFIILLFVFIGFQIKYRLAAEESAQQAKKARDEADHLVRYMNNELRDELAPYIPLAASNKMLKMVIEHYQNLNNKDDDQLQNYAYALASLGVVQLKQDNLEDSLGNLQTALELFKLQSENSPMDNWLQQSLWVSFIDIGILLQTQGKLEDALTSYKNGLQIAEQLAARKPTIEGGKTFLSTSHTMIGTIQQVKGELSAALKSCQNAQNSLLDITTTKYPLSTEFPSVELMGSDSCIGTIYFIQGNLTEASGRYQAGLQRATKLKETYPTNNDWQLYEADFSRSLGDIKRAHGNLGSALSYYQKSLNILSKLINADPTNAQFLKDKGISHIRIGDIQKIMGNVSGASRSYQNALLIFKYVTTQSQSNNNSLSDLSFCYEKIADLQLLNGKRDDAFKNYQEELELNKKLATLSPSNSEWQRNLSFSYNKIADVLLKRGKKDDAFFYYKQSFDIRSKLTSLDPTNAKWQTDLAASYSRLAHFYAQGGVTDKNTSAANQIHAITILRQLNAANKLMFEHKEWLKDGLRQPPFETRIW